MPKSVEPQASWLNKIPQFDKMVHFRLYAILSFLWYYSNSKKRRYEFFLFVVVYALFLGTAIELIQPSVGRSKEFLDLLADWVGCFAGIMVKFEW
jgi:VanZ family protein